MPKVELNQDDNNGLQKNIKMYNGNLKSKEVQVLLIHGKKHKELIHNLEINHTRNMVQTNEANFYPLYNQEVIINVEPIMRPIIETNEPSLGFTNGPIFKSN